MTERTSFFFFFSKGMTKVFFSFNSSQISYALFFFFSSQQYLLAIQKLTKLGLCQYISDFSGGIITYEILDFILMILEIFPY